MYNHVLNINVPRCIYVYIITFYKSYSYLIIIVKIMDKNVDTYIHISCCIFRIIMYDIHDTVHK